MMECSVCRKPIDSEEPAVLCVSGYGNARYLCADCEARLDTVTKGRDLDAIREAMDRITADLAAGDCEDDLSMQTLTDLLDGAKARAERIQDGTYDFSEDEPADDENAMEEIPEEWQETEEDRARDEEDRESERRFDHALNIAWIVIGVLAVVWAVLHFGFGVL